MTQGLGIHCVHCSRNGEEKGEWSWRGLYVGAHIFKTNQQLFKKYTTSWQGLPALLCIAVKRSPQCLCNKTTKLVIKHWTTVWGNCSVFVEVWCSQYYTCTSAAQQSPCQVLGLMSPINKRGKFCNKLTKLEEEVGQVLQVIILNTVQKYMNQKVLPSSLHTTVNMSHISTQNEAIKEAL